MIRLTVICTSTLFLAGCVQDIKEIGQNPALSPVGSGLIENRFAASPTTVDVNLKKPRFSTWNSEKGDLFTDKLAMKSGDILTVLISINDKASLSNDSDSARTVGRGLNLDGTVSIDGAAITGLTPSGTGTIGSTSNFKGTGGTTRSESIEVSMAAVVVKVYGNGNLLVRGSQEVRVNSELRVMKVSGIVRPTDIGANNTVPYERIAEARVSYGGRGHISHAQRPPYGQEILNKILPF